MTNNLPNVAIIISSYNYGKYVINAIDSAMSQDYEGKIKTIVVDDGSSDDSWEKICNITNEKPGRAVGLGTINLEEPYYKGPLEVRQKDHLYAYRINNSGASTARNVGIYQCLDWAHVFGILDADDEYCNDKVSTLVNKLVEHPAVGVAYGDYEIHRTINQTDYIKHEYKKPYDKGDLSRECIVHSGSLIKKEYLNTIKLPNGSFLIAGFTGHLAKGL